jgi:hypothetical protein
LRADVDGDGRRDRVTIHIARKAPDSCGFLLLVDAGNRRYAARVPQGTKWPFAIPAGETSAQYPEPYVVAAARIQRRGLVVAVAQLHGASVVAGSLYAIVRGTLVRLRFARGYYGFSYGGSIASSSVFDCYRGGRHGAIVVTGRTPADPGWRFTRTLLRLEGARFRLVRTRTLTVSDARGMQLSQRWHVSYGLFDHCAAARNDRGR